MPRFHLKKTKKHKPSFLGIPPEIRDRIYFFLLCANKEGSPLELVPSEFLYQRTPYKPHDLMLLDVKQVHSQLFKKGKPVYLKEKAIKTLPGLSIFRCSQQIYNEASWIFCQNNTFTLPLPTFAHDFNRIVARTLPHITLGPSRKLKIDIDLDNLPCCALKYGSLFCQLILASLSTKMSNYEVQLNFQYTCGCAWSKFKYQFDQLLY